MRAPGQLIQKCSKTQENFQKFKKKPRSAFHEINERNCCVKKNFLMSDFTSAQSLAFEMRIFLHHHPVIKIVNQNSVHVTDSF